MRNILNLLVVAGAATALASCGHTVDQKAATGAIGGAAVAGPIGAVVGGAAGAVAGHAAGDPQTTKDNPKL
jgi:osmotically inducible lipoprotein OsmB